ncbi:ATP-binding cassette domain-containing protein [Dickeya dadantii]|uniref:ABC transporter ATP-binding protein n=1 Tax=Dickeya dadantii TaxID=204038 RepID=UPI000980A9B5|nr:oligopeptide/dipeptide ABC transporter ATP-binding protein [Dickeya dadantii]NPE58300.1 ATP-binding cassette domain-containing protein [Dickeya dadantii]UAY97617.1 ATP-binding cassette domain-containing protein [Dickeya dadantii]
MNGIRYPLLEAEEVDVTFPVSGRFPWQKREVRAVNGVSLQIAPGETLGLVGESGSGKSTLGRALLQLETLKHGRVRFNGIPVSDGLHSDVARMRQETAMIFQDPFSSLNPRQTLFQSIAEVLKVHKRLSPAATVERVNQLLAMVGLRPEHGRRYPHDLSGGQCQRAGIARALALEPQLVVADECVSALDVSIQGQIINLLMSLRAQMGLAMIFIAHDLAVVRRLCDRVAVMYLGRIVEEGPTEAVFNQPQHPYTAALISAIPDIDPDRPLPANGLMGEPPSPLALPPGCAFHPRCAHAVAACRQQSPSLQQQEHQRVACLRAGEWRQAGASVSASDVIAAPGTVSPPITIPTLSTGESCHENL